jgi:Cytidylyltransferase-like
VTETVAVGAYPGTFNPPTVAHLAVAEAAVRQGALDRLDLVVSRVPLGKEPVQPRFEDRVSVLEAIAGTRPWLGVRVTDRQLIAEVAAGYDAVVLGADKWLQVIDPAWYGGSGAARDDAVARLPRLLLVTRPPHLIGSGLPPGSLLLDIGPDHREVSSTAARAGRRDWMAPEAIASERWPDRRRDPGERAD